MRRLPQILLILAFLLGTPKLVYANTEPDETDFYPGISFRFEKLSIDEGLSQNAGLALLQDSQGFLWIGTQDGVNRYSGVDLITYKNDPDDTNSISHNSIISLFEDHEGMLWIGTWGGGLNRLDLNASGLTVSFRMKAIRMLCQTLRLLQLQRIKMGNCGLAPKMVWRCLTVKAENLSIINRWKVTRPH